MEKHLVVARYREDPSWISSVDVEYVYLYEKHEPYHHELLRTTQIPLNNIGRESHSYIHHIVNNYDRIAEWTIFSQANPFVHCKGFIEIVNSTTAEEMWDKNIRINNDNILNFDGFMGLGKFVPFDIASTRTYWHPRVATMKNLWRLGGIKDPFPQFFPNTYGAIFAAHRNAIRRQNLEFWEAMLEFHRSDWCMPYAMELLWPCIFDPKYQFNFPRLLL